MRRPFISFAHRPLAALPRLTFIFTLPWLLAACINEVSEPSTDVNQESASPGTVLRSGEFGSSETCPQGGVRIEIGLDENGNGELDDGEVQQQQEICNGLDGTNGSDGTNGLDGISALVNVDFEAAGGGNCAFGGIKIETGLDDSGDGTLSAGEVDNTQFVCNGADGQDSADAGLNSLIETASEPEGSNCTYGGIRIDSGTDANANGVLDNDEKNAPSYVCNTQGVAGGTSLVELTAEPAGLGSQCTYGGTRIDSGIDENESGSLDSGEINHTSYVCETQACLWTDNGDGTTTVSCEGDDAIVLLNPDALDYTGRATCVVSIDNPDDTESNIPMIYTVDDIGEDLKYVTLTILDGERQNSNSRLLTSTNPEYEFSIINLYFDNLGTASGGRYIAALSEAGNIVEFTYIDSDLVSSPDNRFTQAFQAFDDPSDGSEGLCNRVQIE